MNKIVCDICGTSYAESANQCPICGCVHSGDVQRVTNEINSDGKVSTGYTYVKGGRFSKNNVKKRSNGKPVSRRKKQSVASKNLFSGARNRADGIGSDGLPCAFYG